MMTPQYVATCYMYIRYTEAYDVPAKNTCINVMFVYIEVKH